MQQKIPKEFRQAIVRKENQSNDANVLASQEYQRNLRIQQEKKNRMQSFMNSTKLNASKIAKEQQKKINQTINVKKVMIDKQKEVKARYTVVDKQKEKVRCIETEPTKVDWKKIEQSYKGVSLAQQKINNIQSDEDNSGIDSEYQGSKIFTPTQLIKEREGIRNKMLNKFKKMQSK